jgi:hypothetical protein
MTDSVTEANKPLRVGLVQFDPKVRTTESCHPYYSDSHTGKLG